MCVCLIVVAAADCVDAAVEVVVEVNVLRSSSAIVAVSSSSSGRSSIGRRT